MKSSALALDRDPSGRFLPWILAALSLVVTVAIGVAFALAALTASWGEIGSDRLTVRIANTGTESRELADRLSSEIAALSGVETARQLPFHEVATLLEPWLGAMGKAGADDLPLPHIIDVQLTDPAAGRQLINLVDGSPDAVVDSMGTWLEPLRQLARLSGLVAAVLALLAIAVIVLVTIFATRSALTSHAQTIELLRLMGAEDGFIARRLQFHSMKQGLLGGAAGGLPGLAIVAVGIGAARLDGAGLLGGLTATTAGWVAMGLLPILVALAATLTARYTVLELLRNRW